MPDYGFLTHYIIAVAGGFASFLSPCVLPLVPSYLGFLAGVSAKDALSETRTAKVSQSVIKATLAFVFGFGLVFVLLGAAASALGQILRLYIQEFTWIAGAILIVFGLHMTEFLSFSFFNRDIKFTVQNKQFGTFSAFLIGLAFAFGWTPCIGFILAPILGLAASEATVLRGAVLLSGYALGLGIPFILAGLFSSAFVRNLHNIRPALPWIMRIAGSLMIITGIALISGWFIKLNAFLAETFPILLTFG